MEYRVADTEDLAELAQLRWVMWQEDGVDPAQQDRKALCESFVQWLGTQLGRTWYVWCAVEAGEIVSHIYIQSIPKITKRCAPLQAALRPTIN